MSIHRAETALQNKSNVNTHKVWDTSHKTPKWLHVCAIRHVFILIKVCQCHTVQQYFVLLFFFHCLRFFRGFLTNVSLRHAWGDGVVLRWGDGAGVEKDGEVGPSDRHIMYICASMCCLRLFATRSRSPWWDGGRKTALTLTQIKVA